MKQRAASFPLDSSSFKVSVISDAVPHMPMTMGFEVNYNKLMELGMEWASYLHFDGSNDFLLELPVHCDAMDFRDFERTIYELQGLGYRVIIAHPERYLAIQKDPSFAEGLVNMGCQLQASSDFVLGGRLGRERKPAKSLFARGLYSYIASDAHRIEHYHAFAKAHAKFGTRMGGVDRQRS